MVTGETFEKTVPRSIIELPPSLSMVAPSTALLLVMELTMEEDKTGAAPALVLADAVGADAVK